MLCNLHPKLFAGFSVGRLVGVVASHVSIFNVQGQFHGLRVKIENAVEDNLRLLDHNYVVSVHLIVIVLYFGRKLIDLTLTHIDGVVNLKEDWLALLLVCLFSF